jgi:hypothetical protein
MRWCWARNRMALAVLLAVSWRIDRGVRRRGSWVLRHSHVRYELRESRRDAHLGNPLADDYSWTSRSRRNRAERSPGAAPVMAGQNGDADPGTRS